MADLPGRSGTFDDYELFRWLMIVKQRIEDQSAGAITISASQITSGVFDPARIPQIPFTRIDLTVSPRLLGRTSGGFGPAEEIQVAGGLTLAAGILSITGLPSGYVIGDLLYASSATELARLADVAAGSYLRSGGVATAPLWSTLKLPNAAVSGDILKASGANVYASAAPQALTRVDDTNVTLTLGGSPASALVNAASLTLGWTGVLALIRGGLGFDASGIAKGGLVVGTAAGTAGLKAVGTNGQVLTADSTVAGGVKWAAAAGGLTDVSVLTNGDPFAPEIVFDSFGDVVMVLTP
jgi:hypothetical protein